MSDSILALCAQYTYKHVDYEIYLKFTLFYQYMNFVNCNQCYQSVNCKKVLTAQICKEDFS